MFEERDARFEKLEQEGFCLRTMVEPDLNRVAELEYQCFSDPWSRDSFLAELSNPVAQYLLLVKKDRIYGYCGIWKVVDEGHITNLCIDPREQDKGLGQFMMEQVFKSAKIDNICRLTLEVRVSNEKAIFMYEKLGFESAGLRKGYYEDTGEDACIMWREL